MHGVKLILNAHACVGVVERSREFLCKQEIQAK